MTEVTPNNTGQPVACRCFVYNLESNGEVCRKGFNNKKLEPRKEEPDEDDNETNPEKE
jgi:hypothetical protein